MQNSPCRLIKNAFENLQTFTATVSSEASAYAEAVEKFAVELSHELGSAFETLFLPNQTIDNLKDLRSEVNRLKQENEYLKTQVTALESQIPNGDMLTNFFFPKIVKANENTNS